MTIIFKFWNIHCIIQVNGALKNQSACQWVKILNMELFNYAVSLNSHN